jgi:hypothetical protein
MKDLFQIAATEIGVKETKGAEHTPQIVKYAQEAGFKTIGDDIISREWDKEITDSFEF